MSSSEQPASFATTRWSLVVAAGQRSPQSRQALEELCTAYWYPLYAFTRRKGYQAAEAQDLTQAFFAELLEKDRLGRADQELGRFRSFLLASLTHFIQNQRRRQQAIKRGGDVAHLSFDFAAGEARYRLEPEDTLTPERIYEQRWAMMVLETVLTAVRSEYETRGQTDLFDALKLHLTGDSERGTYKVLAERLEMTESAIKVAALRLRRRCQEQLRAEIAATVSDPAEVDEEIAHLFSIA